MIRIRNIARETRARGRESEIIRLPDGGHIRVRDRRETVIDFKTYRLNKAKIVLPGEELQPQTCFRVVAGVEEIVRKMDSVNKTSESPAPNISTPQPKAPKQKEPIVDTALPQKAIELDIDTPKIPETAETPKELEETLIVEAPTGMEEPEYTIPPNEDEVMEEGSQPPSTPPVDPLYTKEQLEECTHKQLDELLAKYDIEVPPRSNKTVKIDALLRLNG